MDLVQPAEQDLAVAYRLISAGLSDFFDAVLYATHVRTSLPLVTMDKGLVEFLSSKSFPTEGITLL